MAVDVESQVTAKISQVAEIIDTALASNGTFLQNLENMADQIAPYTLIASDAYVPPDIAIDVDKPGAPDIEGVLDDIQTGTIEDFSPKDIAASIQPISDEVKAWIPKPIDDYTESPYESQLLDALKSKLISDVTNGGTGLSAVVEQAIQDRQIERDDQRFRDARDKLASAFGVTGFEIPDNVLTAQIADLATKHFDAGIDRSRDITVKSFDLAQENTKFIIQQSIVLESALMQHFNQVADRTIKFLLGRAEVSASVFKALIEAYKVEADIYLADITGQTEIERIRIEAYQAKLSKYKTDADVAILKVRALVDKYGVDISAYTAEIGKGEALARVKVSQQQIIAQSFLATFQAAVEAARTNLQTWVSSKGIQASAAQAGGQIYGNYIASAVNSLNAVLHLSSQADQTIASV